MSETPGAPSVWMSENGHYFGEGHLDPEAFREACIRLDRKTGLSEEEIAEDYAGQMMLEHVEHEWWRLKYPGTDNDETYERCGPEDAGAQAWTAWRQ